MSELRPNRLAQNVIRVVEREAQRRASFLDTAWRMASTKRQGWLRARTCAYRREIPVRGLPASTRGT